MGPANARNVGAKHGRGPIILFTDADCVPDRDWIKQMMLPFDDQDVVGVSGTYKTLNKEKLVARFVGYEIAQRHDAMKNLDKIDFIGTFSAGYRKSVFLKLHGFSTKYKKADAEDTDLSYRIDKAGMKMVFQPAAAVAHPHPDNLWKYLKQKYKRGVWRNMLYWSAHSDKLISTDSYTSKTLFPQLFITGIISLILLVLSILNSTFFYLLLIPIFIFIIAVLGNLDLINFIDKRDKKVGYVAPAILFFRNIAAIIGIIVGLIKFAMKKL
jgi:cellulose synthase/poly-beta-1,6-N-acetylglucosamine synthase-like glycosyltransferase